MTDVERIVRTTCQGCHCECGVLVHVKDDKVVKIEGDPDHPMNEGIMCPKGLAYKQLVYHPERLKYPLKKADEKGEGKWQRITWNEALNTIARKLGEIIEKYGPEAIVASYGTGPRPSNWALASLLWSLGSPNVGSTDAHYCFGPTVVAEHLTFGGFITAEVGPDYKNSKCILIWGANPVHTHPGRWKDIARGRARGAKLIVVDPRLTALASKADLWLQIRPATDAALALGMINVIINEELYDKEFVDEWCVGFEELRQRAQEYPPERAAEITWIPKEKIEKAARMYATTKPAVLHHRVGVEQLTNSVQTCRALAILIGITGNIDIKGGNLFPNYPPGYRSRHEVTYFGRTQILSKEVEEKRLGAEEYPLLSGSRSPWGHPHPPTVIKAILTGKPYPVKAWFAANNPLIGLENTKEVYEALKKLDLLVVWEFFMTPIAELADIVLPVTTWLERDELCESSYTDYIAVRQKAIEPLYECWDELKIAFEILKRMKKKFLLAPVESVEELNDYRLKPMGITFAGFKKKGIIMGPSKYKKYEDQGFKTPSKKVELYSSILKEFGYDPLPYHEENPESPISTPELMKEYPLILITGGRHVVYFHSANRQIPWLREIRPEPITEIHPETAKKLGINDGDWVWIETPRMKERIRQRASLTPGIHPKVVHAEAHWWFPEKPEPDHGLWESNINVVIPSAPYGPIVGTVALRGLLCKVCKVEDA